MKSKALIYTAAEALNRASSSFRRLERTALDPECTFRLYLCLFFPRNILRFDMYLASYPEEHVFLNVKFPLLLPVLY